MKNYGVYVLALFLLAGNTFAQSIYAPKLPAGMVTCEGINVSELAQVILKEKTVNLSALKKELKKQADSINCSAASRSFIQREIRDFYVSVLPFDRVKLMLYVPDLKKRDFSVLNEWGGQQIGLLPNEDINFEQATLLTRPYPEYQHGSYGPLEAEIIARKGGDFNAVKKAFNSARRTKYPNTFDLGYGRTVSITHLNPGPYDASDYYMIIFIIDDEGTAVAYQSNRNYVPIVSKHPDLNRHKKPSIRSSNEQIEVKIPR